MILQDKDRQGSATMITFSAAQGRRLDRAQPDGNCLFRSLSKQLFESDVYHGELRMILSEYAASYPDLFCSWTIQDLSLQEHVRKMKEPSVGKSLRNNSCSYTVPKEHLCCFRFPGT